MKKYDKKNFRKQNNNKKRSTRKKEISSHRDLNLQHNHRLLAYNSYTTWATLPLNNWTGEIIKLKPYLSVVDIVWSWWSCFYQEFEDAFEENKFNHLFQSHCALFWPEFTLGFNGGSMYGAETSLFTIGHMNRWGKTKRNNSLWVSLCVKWIKRYNFQGKAKFWQ